MQRSPNTIWHKGHVTADQRQTLTRVRPAIVWLTGLPGSGKSTLAMALERTLIAHGRLAYVLDGDNVRHGLNGDLGFSAEDRAENVRRIGEVAKLFAGAGVMVLTSFISPYRAGRDAVRRKAGAGEFIEVFVDAPLAVCEARDPKGMYRQARAAVAAGHGLGFTGIDSPYEPPLRPEVHLRTDQMTVAEGVAEMMHYLRREGRLP
jgi:adenylyl-sulfate kinase